MSLISGGTLLSGAYFDVYLLGCGVPVVGSFVSVSGLGMEFEYETYCEGGSSYPRYFFKQAVPRRLVLEQGTVTTGDSISIITDMVNSGMSVPLAGTITLRDSFGDNKRMWNIVGAHLVRYEGPPMNSNQASLAVSRMELMYNGCS